MIYRGCADAGFCYPPETKVIPLSEVKATAQSIPLAPPGEGRGEGNDDTAPAALPFSALWALLIGIGVAFTPCVLPMYPLISGIVLGANNAFQRPARCCWHLSMCRAWR